MTQTIATGPHGKTVVPRTGLEPDPAPGADPSPRADEPGSGPAGKTLSSDGTDSSSTRETAPSLAVFAADPALLDEARALAEHLGCPVATGAPDPKAPGLALVLDEAGLALVGDGLVLRADLARMRPRLKPGNLSKELLVRAAKIKGVTGPLRAVDATAGLGDDALLLAAAGFEVRLFERDPVICALLRDGLRRASQADDLAPLVARMHLSEGDSVARLGLLDGEPDVVLLDPMFPARTKNALVKKKFQVIHQLEKPCDDEEALVRAALGARPRKVIIKRTAKGPYLAGVKPAYSIAGKSVRYDCLVVAR